MALETVRYKYRLRPGVQAERLLIAEWHRCRWLWNQAVDQERSGKSPTFARLCQLLTGARQQNGWLRSGSVNAQQQILRTYSQALTDSSRVKGRGRPVIKSRHKTLPTLSWVGAIRVKAGRLILPKGVSIPIVWSRDLPSRPTSVRVYQDTLGHWYASFVVRREVEPLPSTDGGIGVDWGVLATATTSDPAYDLPYLGHRKQCAAELAKAQRKMARRRHRPGSPTSKGYKQAKRQAAKIQKKAARQVEYDSRVWANRLVADHQLIAIEDFKPMFLAQSRLARKSSDIAIGLTKQVLIERAERAGRKVVLVTPAYTSMTCSRCFARAKQRLELKQRVFLCSDCGYTDSRDRNAARTILAVAARNHTSVEDVRRSQHGPQSELGIPTYGGRFAHPISTQGSVQLYQSVPPGSGSIE